ncbi:hypothetical protein V6N13_123673 [Hibiscus sabdariffa]|uniref:Uncharacterized protein n=1 Tax=Hibiscus sabdariffa TaxID=183260 RepID=A0ABR2QUK2_9ROSI
METCTIYTWLGRAKLIGVINIGAAGIIHLFSKRCFPSLTDINLQPKPMSPALMEQPSKLGLIMAVVTIAYFSILHVIQRKKMGCLETISRYNNVRSTFHDAAAAVAAAVAVASAATNTAAVAVVGAAAAVAAADVVPGTVVIHIDE